MLILESSAEARETRLITLGTIASTALFNRKMHLLPILVLAIALSIGWIFVESGRCLTVSGI